MRSSDFHELFQDFSGKKYNLKLNKYAFSMYFSPLNQNLKLEFSENAKQRFSQNFSKCIFESNMHFRDKQECVRDVFFIPQSKIGTIFFGKCEIDFPSFID